MSDASWPSTVNSEPESGDYREVLTPNLGTAKFEFGTPSNWQRSTFDGRAIKASFIFYSNDERDDFWAFWRETLAGGTKPFRWTNPADNVTGRYLFDPETPPQFSAIGVRQWRLDVAFLRLK